MTIKGEEIIKAAEASFRANGFPVCRIRVKWVGIKRIDSAPVGSPKPATGRVRQEVIKETFLDCSVLTLLLCRLSSARKAHVRED